MKRISSLVIFLSVAGSITAYAQALELDEDSVSMTGPSLRDDEAKKLIASPVLEAITPEVDSAQRNEASISPGAEMRTLDPRYMEVKVVYPEKQPSWWEQLFNDVRGWF